MDAYAWKWEFVHRHSWCVYTWNLSRLRQQSLQINIAVELRRLGVNRGMHMTWILSFHWQTSSWTIRGLGKHEEKLLWPSNSLKLLIKKMNNSPPFVVLFLGRHVYAAASRRRRNCAHKRKNCEGLAPPGGIFFLWNSPPFVSFS